MVASGGRRGAQRPAGNANQYTPLGGPPYPPGSRTPHVRYYTNWGLYPDQPYVIGPPWSSVVAYDLNAGTIRWKVPLGQDAEAEAEGAHDTGAFMAEHHGMIVTSTGLIFIAASDGKLRALDEDTGEVLWTATLPAGSEGIPTMYEVGGRQYLVISASSNINSGGGHAGRRLPPGTVHPDLPRAASRSYCQANNTALGLFALSCCSIYERLLIRRRIICGEVQGQPPLFSRARAQRNSLPLGSSNPRAHRAARRVPVATDIGAARSSSLHRHAGTSPPVAMRHLQLTSPGRIQPSGLVPRPGSGRRFEGGKRVRYCLVPIGPELFRVVATTEYQPQLTPWPLAWDWNAGPSRSVLNLPSLNPVSSPTVLHVWPATTGTPRRPRTSGCALSQTAICGCFDESAPPGGPSPN